MHRRSFLAASAASLAAPRIARAAQSVLRMVPQANLTSIDPIWTTANITRNHGFMVYDTLYGLDASLQPQPQMAAGHQIDDDGHTVTITLRDGLIFHDGEKVRAADAVASLRRWMKRNPYGQALEPVTDELDRPRQFPPALPPEEAIPAAVQRAGLDRQRGLRDAGAHRRHRPVQADQRPHRFGTVPVQ